MQPDKSFQLNTQIRCIWLGLCCLLMASWAQAESVSLTLPNKVVALATFFQGKPAKPALLILHGFLQTKEFPTVARLAAGLSAEGYTVLAPTLTLGVTHRRQSLACEAIHTHTMQSDEAEIEAWLQWLGQRQKGPVILIGHSLGSVTLLDFLDKNRHSNVDRLLGVSITEGRSELDPTVIPKMLTDLNARIKSGKRAPVSYPYSYCRNLNATPESLITYLEWTPERVLKVSKRQSTKITYLMGSEDDRLGPYWIERLKKAGPKVVIIEGATHFMDGTHEFDLLDSVLSELKGR